MIETATRLSGIGEYYFSQKLREIDQLNREGKQIINLGIGSPDLPPHPDVVQTLIEASLRPDTHAYQSYKGSPVLRKAISNWYDTHYRVSLDPDREVLPLIGSKEGIVHICMSFLGEGDQALIPDPGYPTYRAAVQLAGATPVTYELRKENDWYPDLEALARQDLRRVRIMWINYPHMPTGQQADEGVFEALLAFAKAHDILLCHDNPYSFILNAEPKSILSIAGAKEHAIELNSLSKSHNMAGWRVGMLCSNAANIDAVLRFKSNMDSGMFLPVQLAAAKALELGPEWYQSLNEIYQERRRSVSRILDLLGCRYDENQSGMFLWAEVPSHYASGFELSDDILYQAGVFITPGGIFGKNGERYVRVSLCGSMERFEEALARINHRWITTKEGV